MSVTVSGTGTDNLAGLLRPRKTATPIIINGDMQIAQRGTSGTYTGTEDEIETCDRWKGFIGSAGTFTNTQDTDVPTGYGFARAWKIDCTTADSSLSSTDFFFVRQSIEGQNLQVFKKGTSLAETFTLAFWVKSHVAGTYTCELEDKDNSRSVSKSYTISSANTWEKKVLNFPADTTGAFGNDNDASLEVKFWLCAGSGFSSGTLQETWDATTTAEQVASGQVNLASSTDNNWWFTGVQLEVGTFSSTDLPDFQFEDRGTSLARCMRYFERITTSGGGDSFGTTQGRVDIRYSTVKRANATITFGSVGDFLLQAGNKTQAPTGLSSAGSSLHGFYCHTTNSGFTIGHGCTLLDNGTTDATIDASSEL